MKALGIALLLSSVAVHGDVLSNFSPFLGSPEPDYSPQDLVPDQSMEDARYAPFSPADSDFGVQQVLGARPDRAPVNFFLNFDLNYTDNAPAPTPAMEDGSWFSSILIGASWQPHIACGWFADVGITQEFFDFDEGNATDFENMQPYFGVVKNLVDLDDTIFYARYEYQRLTLGSFSNSNYSGQRLRAGLQKSLFVTSRQQLAGSISTAYEFKSDPGRFERMEYAAELTYTWWFTDDLAGTASYRAAYWDFDSFGRHDWNHTAGVELTYRICKNASAYTNVYYSNNDSNSAFGVNDFEAWQAGLGIGLNYSF
ncbi:hypothetical protein [Haloferula sp.]|uniref:hypothetical protein n=1 Tax=Haloferula sp. TaxID=2497595 RepID=UPI00329ACE8D